MGFTSLEMFVSGVLVIDQRRFITWSMKGWVCCGGYTFICKTDENGLQSLELSLFFINGKILRQLLRSHALSLTYVVMATVAIVLTGVVAGTDSRAGPTLVATGSFSWETGRHCLTGRFSLHWKCSCRRT